MKHSQLTNGADYRSASPRVGPRVRVLDVGPFIDSRPSYARSAGFSRRDDMQPLTLADGRTVNTAYVRRAGSPAHVRHVVYVAVMTVRADGTDVPNPRVEFVLPRTLDCTWEEHEARVEAGNRASAASDAARAERERQADAELRALIAHAEAAGVVLAARDPETYSYPAGTQVHVGDLRHGRREYVIAPDLLGALLIHAARTGWTPRAQDA